MSNGREPMGRQPTGTALPGPAPKLRMAVAAHQQGSLAEAERLYGEVLAADPRNPDALQFLGVLQAQKGDREAALSLFDRALVLAPDSFGAHYNRGNALRDLGRLEEALGSYDRVVALKPDHASALNNRGVVLHDLGCAEAAVQSFDRALALQPGHADALVNRGNALIDLKRFDAALVSFARALAAAPKHAGALYGRGNALSGLSRFEEAVTAYDRALALSPGNADILANRGNALTKLGRDHEALVNLDRAVALDPNSANALCNRGDVLLRLKRYAQALDSYDRALSIKPEYPDALYGRAYALTELHRHDEAIPCYEKLLALKPDYAYAPGMLLHAKASACHWRGYRALADSVTDGVRAEKRVASPLILFAVSDSAQDHLLCSTVLIRDRFKTQPRPLWQGETYRHEKLRVAYVSADFNTHAVPTLMAGAFEQHDKARFETIALSHGLDDGSPMRARLIGAFDHFIDVREKSDAEAAAILQQLETDIAIDLTGLTGSARPGILMHRPAPVQAQHLGFAGTMAADWIDYILADRTIIPATAQSHYRENVVYLPDCYLPNDDTRAIAARVPTRAELGLPVHGVVFCSFNNATKFTPDMFDVWMRILRAVEGSVLWLPELGPVSMRNLKHEAENRGIAGARLIFAPYAASPEEHLARLSAADLFLDTLPYNAHSTAADALWAGLPLLTCPGEAFPARVAASLLHAVGLPELVAASLEDYEAQAVRLARDPALLGALKTKLKQNPHSTPLFDTKRFTRNLEAAYTAMWDRHRQGHKPESFAVTGTP